jgi:hypothetical protein
MRRQPISLTSTRGTPNDSNPLMTETQVTKGHTALKIGLSIGISASILISFLIGTFLFIHTRRILQKPMDLEGPMQMRPATGLSTTPSVRISRFLPNTQHAVSSKDTFYNYTCSASGCPRAIATRDVATNTRVVYPAVANDSGDECESMNNVTCGYYTSTSDTEVESEVSQPLITIHPDPD